MDDTKKKATIISLMGYFGGKSHMVKEINSFTPSDTTLWVDAFAGSGVVTLNRDRGDSKEIMNDIDFNIYNIHDLMSRPDTAQELMKQLYKLPYAKEVYKRAQSARRNHYVGLSRIDRAVLQYASISQSYSATQRGFAKRYTSEAYHKALKKKLPLVARRLQGVTVTNRDAIEVIKEYGDIPTATIYADPPYRKELRNSYGTYGYELDDRLQRKLLRVIYDIRARVILSGYRSDSKDLYDLYLQDNPAWHLFRVKEVKKHCQHKAVKDTVSEYFWCNFEPPENAIYLDKIY